MNLMCTIFYLRSIYISCRKYNCQNHIRVELFSTCLLLTEKMVQNSKPSLFQFHAIITSASLICFDTSFSIKISSYQVNLDLNILLFKMQLRLLKLAMSCFHKKMMWYLSRSVRCIRSHISNLGLSLMSFIVCYCTVRKLPYRSSAP